MASSTEPKSKLSPKDASSYPENPVLVRVWRGNNVESQHRGAWVLSDSSGAVIEGEGTWSAPVFTRSSVKSFQALPLFETGAAQRFAFTDAEVALALASHNAEAQHTDTVERLLARIGLSTADLRCGPQMPADPEARAQLRAEHRSPGAVHNNCSGKHAGFLALAVHLGVEPRAYLDPDSEVQRLVKKAVLEMTGVEPSEFSSAIDGCSAPTFRMPLRGLATAFARVANPSGLARERSAACRRMLASVAAYPELIAGRHQRICTDLARVTHGRLFPKVGGEAVYGIGLVDKDRGLAIKIDDGGTRALHAMIVDLLRRFEFASASELEALASWEEKRLRNWAGIEVGRTQVVR